MARITTKDGLISYIRSQLGEPIINVECTDVQIGEIIDTSISKFTEYAYGTLEDVVLIELSGAQDYELPSTITNIIKLSKGGGSNILSFDTNFGAGYVPNIWSEQFFSDTGSFLGEVIQSLVSISSTQAQLEKYFGDDIYYNFNHLAKKLQVLENYSGVAALHYQYEYLANESNDLVYNHEWVKAYTKAKTKELWGTITGKFDQTLVGGARINYADMKSEANEEITRLNEELLTKWSDPAPLLIG